MYQNIGRGNRAVLFHSAHLEKMRCNLLEVLKEIFFLFIFFLAEFDEHSDLFHNRIPVSFRWAGNTGIKGAHSKVLEVLVVPGKTHKVDMSLTLPQVGVKFPRLIIRTRVLLIFV